jgi:hypothetical protein
MKLRLSTRRWVRRAGVGLVLLGLILPMIGGDPEHLRDVPSAAPEHLGFGGFALIVVGLAGRSATRPFGDA